MGILHNVGLSREMKAPSADTLAFCIFRVYSKHEYAPRLLVVNDNNSYMGYLVSYLVHFKKGKIITEFIIYYSISLSYDYYVNLYDKKSQ